MTTLIRTNYKCNGRPVFVAFITGEPPLWMIANKRHRYNVRRLGDWLLMKGGKRWTIASIRAIKELLGVHPLPYVQFKGAS